LKRLLAALAILWVAGAWAGEIHVHELPVEARATLELIKAGGPFPYPQDGRVFSNREKLLPLERRGYYREYTVRTPGVRDRGARRIVAGKSGEYYYTADHYRSFKRILE
jgi:ribonuclease T1